MRLQRLSRATVAVQGPGGAAGAAGAEMATEGASAAACLHDGVRRAADKQWVDHVLPRRPVYGCAGGEQTVLERVQVTVPCYILQKLSCEDAAIHALCDRDLRNRLSAGWQAFYHQFTSLSAQRHYLKVEVSLL